MWGNLFHFMSRASRGNPFSRTTFLIDFLIALTVYCGALDRRIANIEIELALVLRCVLFYFRGNHKVEFTSDMFKLAILSPYGNIKMYVL